VERNFGYAVARAYAGHEGGLAGAGVTATYVRADLDEVAVALSALPQNPTRLLPRRSVRVAVAKGSTLVVLEDMGESAAA
jgi:hypothetical protein